MKALCKGFLIFSLSIFGVNNNYNTFNVLDGLTPGDSSVPSTWGQEKIQLNEALNLSNPSKKVKIGLIDSGIDSEYEKLNKLINYNKGKDYISNNPYTDTNGHGTHVAGIISSVMNYSNIEIYSYKVLDNGNYGKPKNVVDAIKQAQIDGCDIINLSLSYLEKIFHVKDILQEAISSFDGLVVCSSSNFNINYDNDKNELRYPACLNLDNLITVGASNLNDERWSEDGKGSNFGKNYVDLFAPGYSICSTYPTSLDSSGYFYTSGTSMATPFVTGVCGLILSNYPSLSVKELKNAILNNVDKTNALSDICKTGGRLNAYKALKSFKHTHSFNVSFNKNNHTYSCDCGYTYSQNHEIKTRYFDRISHKEMCFCGYSTGIKEAHILKQSDISNNKGFCLECGSLINLKTDISIIEPMYDSNPITLNGSYKLSNGIIILCDEDFILYEQGLLDLTSKEYLLN